jgi:RHS repeat-associated protein
VWSRGEVYAQGGHVNTYANGDTFFAHDDQIGTTRVRTNHSGTIVQHCENEPFGTYFLWCGGVWESDVLYTGQLGLDDGMIVFPARSFHSQSGRFMVPDPAGMAAVDPSNPQTWNRYAYVANNPVSFVDPMGLNLRAPCELFGNDDCGPDGGGGGCDMWSNPLCGWGGGGGGGWGGGGGTHGPVGGGGPTGPSAPETSHWPGGETTGLPQLPTQPLTLGDLLGLTPGCDFGVCMPIGNGFASGAVLATPAWWNSFTSWLAWWGDLFKHGKDIADTGVCLEYARRCKNDIQANAATCNANQDPNKILIDGEQCQLQGRTNCSSAGWNNVQCSGLFDDENCKKAWECGLKTTTPQ